MKEKHKIVKLFEVLSLICLYHISGNNSLFLYTMTLCLYNVYISCFSHISLKNTFKKINYNYSKFKIIKYITIIILSISLLFVIVSILLSDTVNIFLNIDNTFWPYLMMSISIITQPLINIFLEYLESYNKPKLSAILLNAYYILEIIFLLIIGIGTITIFKFPIHISISLLYISKILSFMLIAAIVLIVLNRQNINFYKLPEEQTINYKKEIKNIIQQENHKSIIELIKNSYYYISIIVLYIVLSTRYSYNIELIENNITFIYLYGISIINYILFLIQNIAEIDNKKTNVIANILKLFKFTVKITIIMAITSPLICNIIFMDNSNSKYFTMISFMLIFLALYNITFKNIKNKKIIYISLISGIITKLILIIPLINSFYRMGYDLIYGDIISTIISMIVSTTINYIYLKGKNKKEKTLDKILTTLYESIILCIILVILQFIIPMKTDNYIKSIILLGIYIFISIAFLNFKKKKRG